MNFVTIVLSVMLVASVWQMTTEERVERWKSSRQLAKEYRRQRKRGRGKRGRPGQVGPPGNPGPPGLPGRDGQQGLPGISGEAGIPGDAGLPGDQGIKGERGRKGDKGNRGVQGFPGQACFVEKTGVKTCIKPPTGPEGPSGATGDPGPPGDQGQQGLSGKNGSPGATGPRGPPGRAVDAINIRCHTRHNKVMLNGDIIENLQDLMHAHCDPLQFLQGMKFSKDTASMKLIYTCCTFY